MNIGAKVKVGGRTGVVCGKGHIQALPRGKDLVEVYIVQLDDGFGSRVVCMPDNVERIANET